MRKPIVCGLMAALAVPAVAAAGDKPKPPKPDKPAKPYCTPKTHGYNARGTLVDSALTQTAGADTAKRGDDRYSGTLTVDVTKVNHKAAKGERTYTLDKARVRFHPRKDTVPTAGDRVKVKGKLTRLGKKCDTNGFTPTLTIRRADIKAKKAAKA